MNPGVAASRQSAVSCCSHELRRSTETPLRGDGYAESSSKSLCTKTRYFHAKGWPKGLGDSWEASTISESRIETMNRSEPPSPALRAPSPPLGEKEGMRGYGSWRGMFLARSGPPP